MQRRSGGDGSSERSTHRSTPTLSSANTMLALLRTPLLAAPRAATRRFSASARASDVLLFVEHKAGAVNAASLSALTAARKLGAGDVHALVGGKEADIQGVADAVAK